MCNSDEKNVRVRVNNTLEPGTLVAKIGAAKQDSASSYGTKELNLKKVKITVNGETQPETLVAAVGAERDIVSEKLKELTKTMKQRMESAQTGMDDAPEVLDVTRDIIRIAEGYTYDDLSDQQKLLVGYNQTANPPPSVYEQPEVHHNVITEFQGRIDTFKNMMKSSNLKTLDGRDIEEILNLWSLPYDIDPITGQIVFNLLNYETLSEHLSLNGKHAFRAYRSSGILRSSTPALICANLTLELFLQTICGDVYPYAYPKDTDPLDFVSERAHSYMMRAYVEILLRPAAEDKRIVFAIGSKSTGKTFAKHVYKGGLKELFEVYKIDPTQWISASDGKLDFNYHPESLYNLLYCIYMLVKCEKNDEFATNERWVIDPNAEACTFAMGFFEEGSAIFELVMQNFLSLCRLGGTNCAKARAIAVISYYVLLQERMTPEDALECIEQCMRPEDRSHVIAHLKFEAMSKLSALPADEVDLKEVEETAELLDMKVNDLQTNIDACRKGRKEGISNSVKNREKAIISYHVHLACGSTPQQALSKIKKERQEDHGHLLSYLKFDVMAKFSALPADEVDLKEVEAAAKLLDMKANDLLQNIDECRKGRSNKKVVSEKVVLDSVRHLKCIEKAETHQDVTEGQFVVSEKTTLLSRGCTHTMGITLCTICNTEFHGRSFNKSLLTNHASTENCKRARQLRQNNQSEGDILHLKCIENAEKHPNVTEEQFVISEKTTLLSRQGRTHTKGITLCTVCNAEFSCYDGSSLKKGLLTNHASTKSCKRAREQD